MNLKLKYISLTTVHQRMQDLLRQTDSRDRQKQDQLVNTVSHTLALSVVNNLERNVKNEFKNTVAPGKLSYRNPNEPLGLFCLI